MLQPDGEQRFLMLILPRALCRRAPLTLPTRDLDTYKSFSVSTERNTLGSFSRLTRQCQLWCFCWHALSKQTHGLSTLIAVAGAKHNFILPCFHPPPPRLFSQTVHHTSFITCSFYSMLCLSHTPPHPLTCGLPSYLHPALFSDLYITRCQATHVLSHSVMQGFQHFSYPYTDHKSWLPTIFLPPGVCCVKADSHICVAMLILSTRHGSASCCVSITVLWYGEV